MIERNTADTLVCKEIMGFFETDQNTVLLSEEDVTDFRLCPKINLNQFFAPIVGCKAQFLERWNDFVFPFVVVVGIDRKVGEQDPALGILPVPLIRVLGVTIPLDFFEFFEGQGYGPVHVQSFPVLRLVNNGSISCACILPRILARPTEKD